MKVIRSLSRIMNSVACGVLVLMMLLTVSDVLLRSLLRRPILGTTELTENMMACLAFLALAWCAVERSHLKVDLVMMLFPPRVQAVVDSITSLAGLCLVGLITWRSFLEAGVVKELKIESSLLGIPAFPFYYVMAVGFAMLCLVMLMRWIEEMRKAVKE
ncbi:MAG: TRAP transporter small permease [Thermodesulfobacteriota bacterium]